MRGADACAIARSPLHLLGLALCLALTATALLGYSLMRPDRRTSEPARAATPVPDLTRPLRLPTRRAVRPRPDSRFLVARVQPGETVVLRARPFGRVLRRLGALTEFGSPRALSVVRTVRGRWLAVTTPELANGRLGWIDARARALRFARTPIALEIDLSRRELVVREGDRVARRMRVGIGRPESPTPVGRFAITDKLPGAEYSAVYGCCILALSGRQPNLPAGWQGGDRLAIHGTPNPAGIGGKVSAGCLHAATGDLVSLMRTAPVGTPVVVRA
jgi:hypothetical protein